MPPRKSQSFVDRYDLWNDEQRRAAVTVEQAIKRHKLETVRFSFADQHGVLRGKTLVAAEAVKAMRDGVTMTTSLLAKDTAHRTVFPVFTEGGGLGLPEMQGVGNFVMVADPSTFRVLPWSERSGWMLCDIVFPNGRPVPFSTRQLYRNALGQLSGAGFDFAAGLEVEFHLYKIENPRLAPEDAAVWGGEPPSVSLTTQGFQYLTESRFDQVEPMLDVLRRTVAALALPVRSVEVEFGPSQYEFTFAPEAGLAPADSLVLFRSAMKQVARRHGHLVSFMCRPRLPGAMACGWHLHQSLRDRTTGENAFTSDGTAPFSPLCGHFLAGLLAHARAGAAFSTPTVNGYKRYHTAYAMAPLQAVWAHDNRGVMVRVLGEAGEASTHLENRAGEPLANPYLYMASQIHAGLDGIARKCDPGASADKPYEVEAEPLPKSLDEALDALRGDACFRAGFGDAFVDYFIKLKEGEIARCRAEARDTAAPTEVSAWEHREYFDMA